MVELLDQIDCFVCPVAGTCRLQEPIEQMRNSAVAVGDSFEFAYIGNSFWKFTH